MTGKKAEVYNKSIAICGRMGMGRRLTPGRDRSTKEKWERKQKKKLIRRKRNWRFN